MRKKEREKERERESEREMDLYVVKFFHMNTFSLSRKKRESAREKEMDVYVVIFVVKNTVSLSLVYCTCNMPINSCQTNPAFVFTVF